ncbi:hypothetical protein GCM10020219_056850 [Nonomuraea dietziae]
MTATSRIHTCVKQVYDPNLTCMTQVLSKAQGTSAIRCRPAQARPATGAVRMPSGEAHPPTRGGGHRPYT